jgi:hypothetical protein
MYGFILPPEQQKETFYFVAPARFAGKTHAGRPLPLERPSHSTHLCPIGGSTAQSVYKPYMAAGLSVWIAAQYS